MATLVPVDGALEEGVVGRISAILAAFTASSAALPVAELARRADLPRSTTHRLTDQLVAAGMLRREGSKLELGLRMFELGQLVPQQRTLRAALSPFLHDLRDATRQTANLAIIDGTDMLYLDRVPGPHAPPMPFRSGGRHAAHATSLGKAMMAHLPVHIVDEMCADGLSSVTKKSISTRAALDRQLAQVRETGLSYDREETQLGVFCVGSPIFDRHGNILAAVSVTGPGSPAAVSRTGPAVRNAALNMSRALRTTLITAH